MLEINQIYQGDSAILLKQIDDNSIDLTVTSPPYDNLRDYKGYSFDFETIARELYRITVKGGIIVWIVGAIVEFVLHNRILSPIWLIEMFW